MKIKAYILSSLLAVLAWSCDDFLDLEPISEETSATAYDSYNDIEAALTGTYESFQSDAYVWNNILFSDVRSDNHYAGGDNTEIYEMDYLTISATNTKVLQSWSNIYNAILKANIVLENVDGVDDVLLTEERREQIRGEAYFLRAYHYYNLVNLFGGVPLILEPTTSTESDDVNVPRSTATAVFDQILTDLDLAVELLPDTYGDDASVNKARATSGAANALAAKACAQKPNPDYDKALEYIAKLETSEAGYELIEYSYLFDGNHYNNDESILEVQYLGSDEGNWAPQMLLPPSLTGDSWRKFVTPSNDLVNAFDNEGDEIRKNATILWEEINDWVDEYWGNALGSTIPFGYKWKNAMGWASTDRQYILRYGDIVLLKAEALNETGELDAAVTEVNRIRTRAGLEGLTTDKTSSQDVLRTAILKERRLEMAQEGQRWDDLVRYGVAVETMNNLEEIDLRYDEILDYGMTEDKILLPIPQQELDRNSALEPNPSN